MTEWRMLQASDWHSSFLPTLKRLADLFNIILNLFRENQTRLPLLSSCYERQADSVSRYDLRRSVLHQGTSVIHSNGTHITRAVLHKRIRTHPHLCGSKQNTLATSINLQEYPTSHPKNISNHPEAIAPSSNHQEHLNNNSEHSNYLAIQNPCPSNNTLATIQSTLSTTQKTLEAIQNTLTTTQKTPSTIQQPPRTLQKPCINHLQHCTFQNTQVTIQKPHRTP